MEMHIIEATNGTCANWGKFGVARYGPQQWRRRSVVGDNDMPLLDQIGWAADGIWVLDLQTGEGASFRPGGSASADLDKHRIWVCVLFEPFLTWLYRQDLTDLAALPDHVDLDAPFAFHGHRRRGGEPFSSAWSVHPGEVLRQEMDERCLTQRQLALMTGRPRPVINRIITGARAITAQMALDLEKALGISADFWVQLQATHNLAVTRARTVRHPQGGPSPDYRVAVTAPSPNRYSE